MTEGALHSRISDWVERMFGLGLAHHEFTVQIVDAIDDNEFLEAQVHISDDYDSFDLKFKRGLVDSGDDEHIDRVILHELCHIPIHKLMRTARLAETHMAPSAVNIWYRQLDSEMEGVVERFARALYDAHL